MAVSYLGSGYSYTLRVGGQRVEARQPEPALIDGRRADAGDRLTIFAARRRDSGDLIVSRSTSRAATLLALPVLATALLFLIPLAIMAVESLVLRGTDGSVTLSVDQYARFFSDSYYAGSLGLTLATAVLVAAVAIALAYPVALLYWRASRQARSIMLALLLAPFYANIVVTVFGWMVLLAPGGVVNVLLIKAGAIAAPIDFLNGYAAVVLISVHRCLPFVVLLLANALANIDDEVLQCASVCGASGAARVSHGRVPAQHAWSRRRRHRGVQPHGSRIRDPAAGRRRRRQPLRRGVDVSADHGDAELALRGRDRRAAARRVGAGGRRRDEARQTAQGGTGAQ